MLLLYLFRGNTDLSLILCVFSFSTGACQDSGRLLQSCFEQMCACPTLDKNCHRLKTSRIYFYLQILYVMQKPHQCNVCFCCHGNRRLALTDHIRYSVTDSGTCTLSACTTDATALIHTHCGFLHVYEDPENNTPSFAC